MPSSNHERFSQALYETARAWRLALDRRLRQLGLSQASWQVIAAVARSGTMSQAELAAAVGVERPTMVVMIDRLVENGCLVRVPGVDDRRVKRIELTVRGQEMCKQLRNVGDSFLQDVFRGFDREWIEAVTCFLEAFHATIETQGQANYSTAIPQSKPAGR